MIQNVVIFQNVLASVKIKALNFRLSGLQRFGNHAIFNRLIFGHFQKAHYFFNGIHGKNPHQIVFQRNIKLGLARVALPARTAAQLIINPPGFVLEAFNAVGTWQTQEASTKAPIDMTADLNIDGKTVHVNNPSEMMKAIAASTSAQTRYAGKVIGFTYEREGDVNDSCTLQDISNKINAGSYPVLTLLTDLTQTQQFRTRAVGVTQ